MTSMFGRWRQGEAQESAHVHHRIESRDCDGDYLRAEILRPTGGQDAFALLRSEVFETIPEGEETTIIRSADGAFEWHEPTDEGYRHHSFHACEKACSDDDRNLVYSRDLSAERAGY